MMLTLTIVRNLRAVVNNSEKDCARFSRNESWRDSAYLWIFLEVNVNVEDIFILHSLDLQHLDSIRPKLISVRLNFSSN